MQNAQRKNKDGEKEKKEEKRYLVLKGYSFDVF